MNNQELYHFGILGQKWGVRRFQNEDGTWTEAGKKRRRESEEDYNEDYKSAHDKTNVKYLSDKELQRRINRLNNENTYNRLTQSKFKKYSKSGANYVNERIAKQLLGFAVGTILLAAKPGIQNKTADIIKKGTKFVKNSIDMMYII